ncbi:MAG: hypothetical protein A3H70_02550 [Candidatus Komeilibacteria bacterium RIFCSPLOWO2_02_FULL_48_11]|uniref:Uncharacterized protein n=1 Tax=Candidatus Komeilibacteria bacterium RIFCSPLOWO2_02_FULL_48_11 TaxID=1798553 RepID=A0A1G2BS31_9BACT|nr:MAG: hypothetical protein A3H70_02550 [Candidatus Komeilibacteria bacterium RIFCSPLOWO2_02_FULL_48_11]
MAEIITQQPNTAASAAPAAIKPPSYLLRWFLQYYQLVTAASCILLLVLGYFLLLSPKLTRARIDEAAKFATEQERQKNLELKLQYLAALSKKRAETSEADIQKIAFLLPSGPAIPEFLASLEGIARESQVTVEGIELSLIEPVKTKDQSKGVAVDSLPPDIRALEASVNVAATTYSALKTFLANIEHSLRLMDVVALLYSPAAKSYTIMVHTYYLPK